MGAAKHTPGPWLVLDAGPKSPPQIAQAGTLASVAEMGGWAPPAEELANAQLIAAAPELLAALVEIADPCALRSAEGFRMIARAAIAKVTGGAA